MPELPEVETICRGLKPALMGKKVTHVALHRPNLRYPFPTGFAAVLLGKKIRLVSRRAKYLLIEMEEELNVVIHLGMSGRVKIFTPQVSLEPEAHDHVVITLNCGTQVVYNDPRRFGFMDMFIGEGAKPDFLKKLGVEPLGNAFNAAYVAQKWEGKKTSLKAALLDQRIIAGLGNIYVLEALFRTGISPFNQAGSLVDKEGGPKEKLEELVVSIKDVLREAIKSGGSTLRDYQQSDGSLGYFQHHFQIYGREGEACLKKACDGVIARKVQNGRSTFYCEACQK